MQYGDDKIFFFDGGVLSIGGGEIPRNIFKGVWRPAYLRNRGEFPANFIAQKINWRFFISKISLMIVSR